MSIFSVTEIETFKRCRLQWDFSSLNRQSLAPVTHAPALALGSLIHETLAQWRSRPSADPTILYKANSRVEWEDMREAYKQHVGCYPSDEETQRTKDALTMGASMIANYAEVYKTPLPDYLHLVANEQTFVVPVPGTEHCTLPSHKCLCMLCDPYPASEECDCPIELHHLEGTLDALVADDTDRPFPYECKSYSRKPTVTLIRRAFQFTSYMWILHHPDVNMPALSMLYDGLYKKATEARGKQLQDNFLRVLTPRTPHEIEYHGKQLASVMLEMGNPHYIDGHVPYLQGGCWDCSFEPLHQALEQGTDTDYVLANYVRNDHKVWHRNRKLWEDKGD